MAKHFEVKERLHKGYAQSMEVTKVLADERSQFQQIRIFDTVANGRVKGALRKGGYATFQTGVPFYQPWEITEALEELARFFPRSGLYLTVVPTYIGGFMALSWASKGGKALGTPAGIRKAAAAYKK